MRRINPRKALVYGALAAFPALIGAALPGTRKAEPVAKAEETVADLATVSRSTDYRVAGIGLVIGLDDTGSIAAPSADRQRLLEDLRKARVEHADRWLSSLKTSMVVVNARIPAGVGKTDRLDVEISLPTGSTTKSLAGGHLLMTRLAEVAIAGGEIREGQFLAEAGGPIMIGNPARPDDPKVGRVLGGGHVFRDIPFLLLIKPDRQTVRTAAQLQAVINRRFHEHQGVDPSAGMAVGKSDKHLILKVPKIYHQNQLRYFQVVHSLPIADDPKLVEERVKRWGEELLDPKTAGLAALRLEGLGKNAINTLKTGLASPNAQVRFFSAEALAYLDDDSGVDVLTEAAIQMPEFRAFALVALGAMSDTSAEIRLTKLMDQPDVQVRYGAFNALRTHDPSHPALGQVRVVQDEPEPEDNDLDPDALDHAPRRRRERAEDPFSLYVVDSEGPSLVHVTRTRRCEIVVFGRSQKLLTPVVLGGSGAILLNAVDGDQAIQITRIEPGHVDDPEWRVTSPLDVGEVVREVANLGATYPEILSILQAASKQGNLPGPLVIDAAPAPTPRYDEAQLAGRDATSKKDDALTRTSAASQPKPKRKHLMDRVFRRADR